MNHTEPFVFYTERRLVALTGQRASNLNQLLGNLRDVPGSSISFVASLFQSARSMIDAAPLTEPAGNVCRGGGLRVRELSCSVVEIGERGCHDLAAAIAAAIVVPNKFRQEVEHDAGYKQRCLDGKVATVGAGRRPCASKRKLDLGATAPPVNQFPQRRRGLVGA